MIPPGPRGLYLDSAAGKNNKFLPLKLLWNGSGREGGRAGPASNQVSRRSYLGFVNLDEISGPVHTGSQEGCNFDKFSTFDMYNLLENKMHFN